MNRGRADGNLLNTEADDILNLLNRFDAPTIAQWHATLGGEVLDQAVIRLTVVRGRVDIDHEKLVDLLLVEDPDGIDGVAHILRAPESNGLDQSAVLYKQTGDDPGSQHAQSSAKFFRSSMPQ